MWGCKTSVVVTPPNARCLSLSPVETKAKQPQMLGKYHTPTHGEEKRVLEREKNRMETKARGSHDHQNKAGAFFMATLVMWAVSVFFEILFNKRAELAWILSGFCFYQSANWVVRNWVSRDPLFVNTCVSLLHSSITSASGSPILFLSFFMSFHWCLCLIYSSNIHPTCMFYMESAN